MKFFLISDNIDTQMGMRLAGIEGVVAHEAEEVEAAVQLAVQDPDVGILLVTGKLMNLCPALFNERKRNYKRPLIVEIPDRHGGDVGSSLERYIGEALGIRPVSYTHLENILSSRKASLFRDAFLLPACRKRSFRQAGEFC